MESRVSTDSLYQFLARSSPALHAMSMDVDDATFSEWAPSLSCIDATLENLEVHLTNSNPQFENTLLSLHRNPDTWLRLPRLQTLSFKWTVGLDLRSLASFLDVRTTSRSFAKIRSFRCICRPGSFFQDRFSVRDGPGDTDDDTGINHLAKLARRGVDIYIGNEDQKHGEHVGYVPQDWAYTWMQTP
ncbi:hypothetical protein MVEN_01938800 [Mycena venus]|uniref:Uncharacterized protein n=1 Tax=Mycena venus TaxID=2733690 RepID=A0A8H6XFM8_9AGAR|nr:hypothetical protein MVEN_01938800 [Mycena venus]